MSEIRDWTLQYSMIWAAVQTIIQDCECEEGWISTGDECTRVLTLPTEQPPTFTPLLMTRKSYQNYSKFGTAIYDPGFNIDYSGTYTLYSSAFWKNIPLNLTDGPMNRCAIWTDTVSSNQQIGFSVCVNIPTTKTYLIGFGVDNFAFIRIDGTYIIKMVSQEIATTFDYWRVYPVTIKAGVHVLEIVANNVTSIAAVGAEIYDCTPAELMAIDTVEELDEVLVWSTKDLDNTYTNLGTNGYPIMEDYALVFCFGDPPFYRKVEYAECSNEINLDAFITEWNVPAGSFTLPLRSGYSYNMVVDWGDGTPTSEVTAYNVNNTHSYATGGRHRIKITGTCPTIYVNNSSTTRSKLTKIIQWGNVGFTNFNASFYGCNNLETIPQTEITGIGTFTGTCSSMFQGCSYLKTIPADLFKTLPGLTSLAFTATFYGCSSLTAIPEGLFDYNVNVTSNAFYRTFYACSSLTSIPAGLFDNNTLVSTSAFFECFHSCYLITNIPTDLFRYNSLAASDSFIRTFMNCQNIASIPTDLFRYNTSVTSFSGTFYGCYTLPSIPIDLFRYNTAVATDGFYQTFRGCYGLASIPTGLFDYNVNVSGGGFNETFYGCSYIAAIPTDLFRYNTLVSTSAFNSTFQGCSRITSIPTDLFRYNVSVSSNGFANTFYGCSNITSIPTDLFRYNTAVSTSGFFATFLGCSKLTSIPTDLFRYNTAVTSSAFQLTFRDCIALTSITAGLFDYNVNAATNAFYGTFYGCTNITTVPTDLFRYNTAVSSSAFMDTFRNCSKLASLPVDLFRYNVNVSSAGFQSTFYNCILLASVPADLFRYNTACTSFANTFYGCNKLTLNRNIFCADGEEATRFLNLAVSFSSCFYRTSFTGVQGEAPELWNYRFGELLNIDVAPATDWAADDVITGQTSAANAICVQKNTATQYEIKKLIGAFTLGEIVGVTGDANKLADQGTTRPTITSNITKTYCFGGAGNSSTSISNYANVPTNWK